MVGWDWHKYTTATMYKTDYFPGIELQELLEVHEILNDTTYNITVPDSNIRQSRRQYIRNKWLIHFEFREVIDKIIWVNMVMLFSDIY